MAVGTELGQIITRLESLGIIEILLPFFLIFTIIFAVLERINLFDRDDKNISTVLAFIIATTTVIPHVTGRYPSGYDPITIINALIPSAAAIAVASVLVLILIGVFREGDILGSGPSNAVMGLMLLILAYVFGSTVGWWGRTGINWLGTDTLTLVIVILSFGLIIRFITGGDEDEDDTAPLDEYIVRRD